MRRSLKYLLLVAPAALMIAVLFLYPLGFSLIAAFTNDARQLTLGHFAKVYALYSSDIAFTVVIVLISVALLAAISITLSAVITLSPCRPIVRMLGFLYRLPLFIPFIVAAQMMRTFLAKNGLMNNALVATDLFTPMETVSWLGWKGIIITFVWKQLAFATLLICGAMAALEQSQILAARNLGASRVRILFDVILPQVLPAIGVALVLSTVTMMSVLSVPLMIGVGTPTMMTVDMAFRVNSYGDYAVANALGVVSLLICGALSWFYLRHSLQQKGAIYERGQYDFTGDVAGERAAKTERQSAAADAAVGFYAVGDVWPAAELTHLDGGGELVFPPCAAQPVGAEILVSGVQSLQRCFRFTPHQRADCGAVGGGVSGDFGAGRLCAFTARDAAAGAVDAAVFDSAGVSEPDGVYEYRPAFLSVGVKRDGSGRGAGA
jgi:ABC-type sugar transport system permease subunit